MVCIYVRNCSDYDYKRKEENVMGTTIERYEQNFCGVTIFTWEEWDDVGTGVLQYYNVQFPFESMKKYNGTTAVFSLEGQLTLFDENDNEIIDIWIKNNRCKYAV